MVIASSAKLDYQMGYLVVRKDTVTKIHLSEIRLLLIESTAVSLTAALLAELTDKKIKVIFCDAKRNPSSELLPYYGAHDTSLKIRNQIAWSDKIKVQMWTEIVSEKIRKQREVLLLREKKEEADLLGQYLEEMELGDATNREGHAAKVYFNALFGKDFSRSVDNVANAALNYGYSILLSAFTREITANGYLFNPFNLASDLMEPFRPLVDRRVLQLQFSELQHEQKMQLVDILNMEIFVNERKEYVANAIKIYCKSVFDAISDEDVSQIRFYSHEL